MGALLFFLGSGDTTRDVAVFKTAGAFIGGLSVLFELGRRMETLTKPQQREMIDSLEKIV